MHKCVYMYMYIYKRTGISISLFPKYGTLYDCGGRNYRLQGERKEKKTFEFISVTLIKCFKISLCIEKETGEVSQWHVTAHRCFKASPALHLHFHVIISLPFHCELLQKMTSNTWSTLAIIEMPAIIHYRSSYSAFYLPWLSFNDRALWRSEHMSVCFRRIYLELFKATVYGKQACTRWVMFLTAIWKDSMAVRERAYRDFSVMQE